MIVTIRCNQCSRNIPIKSGRFCPFCENTLEDEVRDVVKEAHPINRGLVALAIILTIIAIGTALLGIWYSRHYEWTEYITSPVGVKDYYQTSHLECGHYYTEIYYDSDGDPHSRTECAYYNTVYDDHYTFILNDTHEQEVSFAIWSTTEVGQNYTYSVRHFDWRPGMEKAPIPIWVWIVPLSVGPGLAGGYVFSRYSRRVAEISEWKKSGDLRVDDEE